MPVPSSLVDPLATAANERALAIIHYAQTPLPAKSFDFEAYKGTDVVTALEALFNTKCAYCEGKFAALQPMDVEHFRPKGAVAGDPQHLGYWWLALEWTNLLPSCIDCNRKRKQYIVEVDENDVAVVSTVKTLAGKKDAFPIQGPNRACKPGDDLVAELPLLINPTLQDPGEHFYWRIEDLRFPIVEPRSLESALDPHAMSSIEVFGLNRHRLVEDRGDLLQEMAATFEVIRDLVRAAASMDGGAVRDATLAKVVNHLDRFRTQGAKTKRYSAVAQAYIHQVEREITRELNEALLVAVQTQFENGTEAD